MLPHKRRLYTWTSPDGQHRNQTDYILCSQRRRSSIQSTKTRPGADCGADHELLLPNTPDTITTILCSSWYFPLPEINYKERKYSPNERESLVSLACHWILRIENTPWHKQEFRSYWLDEYHAVFEKNDIDVQMLKWKNVQDKLLSDRRKSQSIHTKWSHLCESECKHIM